MPCGFYEYMTKDNKSFYHNGMSKFNAPKGILLYYYNIFNFILIFIFFFSK